MDRRVDGQLVPTYLRRGTGVGPEWQRLRGKSLRRSPSRRMVGGRRSCAPTLAASDCVIPASDTTRSSSKATSTASGPTGASSCTNQVAASRRPPTAVTVAKRTAQEVNQFSDSDGTCRTNASIQAKKRPRSFAERRLRRLEGLSLLSAREPGGEPSREANHPACYNRPDDAASAPRGRSTRRARTFW